MDSLKSTLLGKHVVDGAVVGILYDDKFGALIEVAFEEKGGKVLDAAGIKKLGKMKGSGFLGLGGKYVTFEGFKMKVGAQKMTTRCLRSNIGKLSRPSAVRTASADIKISGVGKGIKTVAWPVTFAVGLWTASDAYNEEYASGEGLPEDLRRSNAEASAACDVIETGVSVGMGALSGMAAGAALGSLVPGAGTVVGAAVGFVAGFIGGVIGGVVADGAMKTDANGDGKTLRDDIKEGWYKTRKVVVGS